jgi:hypothetical protein
MRARGLRRGFALVVVLIIVATFAVGATVILANVTGQQDAFRASRAAIVLNRLSIEFGKNGQNPSFVGDVGKYPGKLSHLVVPITTADKNDCGTNYTGGGSNSEVGRWTGPYHLSPSRLDGTYDIAPGFVAEDTLHRVPATAANASDPGLLEMVMLSVQLADAQALGLAVDGVTTGAGPKVLFTPNGNNAVTVYYATPLVGC